jgi:hypothetical protein
MDQFTKRYLSVLGIVIAVGLLWWLAGQDSRVSELNELLETDQQLSAYPYQFRVLSLEDGIADISSPRSAQMSATRGLRVMFPELQNASAVSPEMMAAQEQLASVQSRAGKLVRDQDDVRRVRWVLDERWLSRHGIYVQE